VELNPLNVFILGVVGFVIAYMQSRVGKFEELPSNQKSLITAITTFIVPGIASYLSPFWKDAFGDLPGFLTYIIPLLAPALIWGFAQVGHQLDRAFQYLGDWLKTLAPTE
jgi:hypothetical protein